MALHVLSSKDLAAIKQLLATVRGKPSNSNLGSSDQWDHEEFPAPEVYVALTPADGIPAMDPAVGTSNLGEGDIVGAAECDIYAVDSNDALRPVTGLSKRVLNLSSTAVDGDSWVLVTRDKFGSWFATPTATGGGSALTWDTEHGGANPVGLDAWINTAVDVDLPTVGTYLLCGHVTIEASLSFASAGDRGIIRGRLYNGSAGISGSYMQLWDESVPTGAGTNTIGKTTGFSLAYTILAAPVNVRLEVYMVTPSPGGSYGSVVVRDNDLTGSTALNAVKIA